MTVPHVHDGSGRACSAVVLVPDRASFVRVDTAGGDDEAPWRGQRDVGHTLEGHETELGQLAGSAHQDCRVILTAALGAHAACTSQGAKIVAVLHAAEILDAVFDRLDRRRPLGARFKAAASNQDVGQRDDERARAAHAGGTRQVTRERDVRAKVGTRKVRIEPSRRDGDVAAPAFRRVGGVEVNLAELVVSRVVRPARRGPARSIAATAKPRGTAATSVRPPP